MPERRDYENKRWAKRTDNDRVEDCWLFMRGPAQVSQRLAKEKWADHGGCGGILEEGGARF